jgi:hypothetical protein
VTSKIAGSLQESSDGTRPGILHNFIVEEYDTIRTGIYKLQNTDEGERECGNNSDKSMFCQSES